MNIMIDLILCILAVAVLVSMLCKNTIVAIARFCALVIAVTAATLAAPPLAKAAAPALDSLDFYRASAVADLADLAEVRQLRTSALTLAQIDVDTLMQQKPDETAALLAQYGTDRATVETAIRPADDRPAAFVRAMTQTPWRAAVEAILFLALIAVLYAVLVAVFRALLYHFFPKDKKRKVPVLTGLFALLSVGIVVAYIAVPVLEHFAPYGIGILKTMRLDEACAQSMLFGWCRKLYIL